MKPMTKMDKRLYNTLGSIEKDCCSILLSNDNNYIILQGALLFNYILELTRVYYIKDRDPNYDEDICTYREQESKIVNDDGTIVDFRFKNVNPPNFNITFRYTLAKLNIPMLDTTTVSNFIRLRNKCAHDVLQICDAIISNVDSLISYQALLIDIYTRISKELNFSPLKNNLLLITINYISQIFSSGNIPMLQLLGKDSDQYLETHEEELLIRIKEYEQLPNPVNEENSTPTDIGDLSTSPTEGLHNLSKPKTFTSIRFGATLETVKDLSDTE